MSVTNIVSSLVPAVIGAAVSGGAVWAYFRRRRSAQPIDRIGQNLNRLAADVETDLRQLHMDAQGDLLAEAWNRLVDEVQSARREMETIQLRRQAKETIDRYRMKWLTELMNKMPYGLVTVSDDWTISFANECAMRVLEADCEDLVGHRLTEYLSKDILRLRLADGINIDRTFDLAATGNSIRVTSLRCSSETGVTETALFLSDMSVKREVERSRSEFLYHVTHELRTPLTNIKAYAETLSEGVLNDPDELRECYNVIVRETNRLSRLVEDVLSLSQLEAGAARLEMDDVNTARLVRQVVEDMQASADDKELDLILSLPAKVPNIRGDKERLAVVLTNLVGNAVKYTPSGGTVEISCVEDGSRLLLNVKDTGIGIDSTECKKVFEKFYRSESETVSQLPGTGLGLALALEVVRAHGGTIDLESELGKGSTFTIVLPIESLAAVKT